MQKSFKNFQRADSHCCLLTVIIVLYSRIFLSHKVITTSWEGGFLRALPVHAPFAWALSLESSRGTDLSQLWHISVQFKGKERKDRAAEKKNKFGTEANERKLICVLKAEDDIKNEVVGVIQKPWPYVV